MSTTPVLNAAASNRRRWIALAIVCFGQLMIVLDSTIVNVALPEIQRDLHFTQANLTWVINAYLITFGSFLLMAGRLGDLVGRKRIFLIGLVVFTAASAVCGFADDQTVLIVARLVQGIGGALASSVGIALIVTEFPEPAERAKAMGMYVFVAVAGGSIGLLAGGLITESISWHWIFFINVPIGVVVFGLARVLIDERPGLGLAHGVDMVGSFLVTAAMMALVYAIVESSTRGWGSVVTLGFGGGSLLLLGSFFAYEGRISNPILPLRILRLRGLIGSSVVRGLLITGMYSTFFLGSLYLERVLGFNSLLTGLAFLPVTAMVAVLSLGLSARIMHRFGPLAMLRAGLLTMTVGLVLLSRAGPHAEYFPILLLAYLLVGLGAGSSFMPLLTIAMADVPAADAGLASGIVNVSMQISAAIGLAVLGTLATDHTRTLLHRGVAEPSALTSGYHLAFLIGAACVAMGVVVASTVMRPGAAAVRARQRGVAAGDVTR